MHLFLGWRNFRLFLEKYEISKSKKCTLHSTRCQSWFWNSTVQTGRTLAHFSRSDCASRMAYTGSSGTGWPFWGLFVPVTLHITRLTVSSNFTLLGHKYGGNQSHTCVSNSLESGLWTIFGLMLQPFSLFISWPASRAQSLHFAFPVSRGRINETHLYA